MKDQGKVSLCLLLLSSATWAQALWRTVFRRCRVSREQLGIGQHACVRVAKVYDLHVCYVSPLGFYLNSYCTVCHKQRYQDNR